MAKIVIDHLASIHHVEIELKQMNVFIGEQATGKSTLCKAVYYFRNLKEILLDYYYTVGQNGENGKELSEELSLRLRESFDSLFGYSWQLPGDFSMEYYYTEEHFVKISIKKQEKEYVLVDFSEKLGTELWKLDQYAHLFHNSVPLIGDGSFLNVMENKKYYEYLENELSRILDDDMTTYYIPAGRALLSLLCNQRNYLNYGELDPINRKFMQTIETLQPKFADGTVNVHNYYPVDQRRFDARKISDEIIHGMKGEYFYQNGSEYLQIQDSEENVAINFTSSGQQEILWLYNQLYVLMLKEEKSFIIVEEPESHLYPTLQKNITDFIAKCINITGSSAIVTTHSPYILTEMNNLYITGRLQKKDKIRKEVEKTVGKWCYVAPDELNIYKMSGGIHGTEIQTLLNEDNTEVLAEKIDEISNEINEIYTRLFYLEEENE